MGETESNPLVETIIYLLIAYAVFRFAEAIFFLIDNLLGTF